MDFLKRLFSRNRHQAERHPELGEYKYSPTIESWTQRRPLGDGRKIVLCGRGQRPSEEQVALWKQIQVRLPDLTSDAVAAITEPPVKPHRAVRWRSDIALHEIRLELDGTFALLFDTPLSDEINMCPMVVFSDWAVKSAEWVV